MRNNLTNIIISNNKQLLEDNRRELIQKSKRGREEKDGQTRYEKRKRVRVSSSVASYNRINMNELFKRDTLIIGVNVVGETDNYVVTIKFYKVLDAIKKQLQQNNDKIEFKVIYKALASIFNSGDVYIECNCLHPDTKIKLLDGTTRTIEQMKLDFDSGEKLWVYSVDENGDFKPGEVENIWVSGEATEFIKIILDNDEEILTTPEHLYMLRDGTYIQAQDLKENDSLMSFKEINEAVSYFELNHKVKKVERIVLPTTPVYDISVKNYANFLVEAGVILHNCEDYKYRLAYWNTRSNINAGKPETRPSNITNPTNDLGPACKHISAVLANINWLMKVASVIVNYIKFMAEHQERKFADIIYPAIFGRKYDKEVQLNLFDFNNRLSTSRKLLNVANKIGRDRGKFKKRESEDR